jgi:ATP-dependent RNA helicase DDX10/DBP4
LCAVCGGTKLIILFWNLKVDCPEDVPSYIHRVGRTARFNAGGRSVAFFMPSEMKMLMQLHEAKIPVKVIKVCCLLQ